MTRRNATLTALALTAAFTAPALGAPSASIDGAPVPQVIAPGGNITSVVKATERLGWPHASTRAERKDVTALALFYGATHYGHAGTARCAFTRGISRATCTVKARRAGKAPAYGTRFSFRIFEDGSFSILWPTN